MNSDLMRAPCFDIHLSQGDLLPVQKACFQNTVVGYGRFAVALHHSHFLPVDGMAADQVGDGPCQLPRHAPNQRHISLVRGVFREGRSQFEEGVRRLGHDEAAGGIFIQPVNDTGTAVDVLKAFSESRITARQLSSSLRINRMSAVSSSTEIAVKFSVISVVVVV